MMPIYTLTDFDPFNEVAKATPETLKKAFKIIGDGMRVTFFAGLYSHDLTYGRHRIYKKRGKHRKGTYIPATLKGRFSQESVAEAIRELERVVPPNGWTRRDLIIHLKWR